MLPMENTHQNEYIQQPAPQQWSIEKNSFQRVLNVGYHPLPYLSRKFTEMR
jgi:hypothetical protein